VEACKKRLPKRVYRREPVAKDKHTNALLAWLENEGPERQFYPDEFFPTIAGARNQLRRALADQCAPAEPQQETDARNSPDNRPDDLLRAPAAYGAAHLQKLGPQIKKIKEALLIQLPPDGRVSPNLKDKEVLAIIEPVFERNGWRLPKVDSIARARGRRK
jgi:hypothetical protein